MTELPVFSTWDEVLDEYRGSTEIQGHVLHNLNFWAYVHGGLGLVRQNPTNFDPVSEYWHKTERRVLTAFFGNRFAESYAPAQALRSLAHRTFRHFEGARVAGRFGEARLATEANWRSLGSAIFEVAGNLPESEE